MYSPKISEDLIPIIYKTAQTKKQPMTKVVDNILREYLNSNPTANKSISKISSYT